MKSAMLACAAAMMLVAAAAEAYIFDDWLGTWDIEMYYEIFPLEDPMVWIIDNATDDAAFGLEEVSGADIMITWDENAHKYVFADFLMTLQGKSFQGYLQDTQEITIKGTKRSQNEGNGNTDEPDDSCPASTLLEDTPEALALLRCLRDDILAPTQSGRLLISLYYSNGQNISRAIRENKPLEKSCKIMLVALLPLISGTCPCPAKQ